MQRSRAVKLISSNTKGFCATTARTSMKMRTMHEDVRFINGRSRDACAELINIPLAKLTTLITRGSTSSNLKFPPTGVVALPKHGTLLKPKGILPRTIPFSAKLFLVQQCEFELKGDERTISYKMSKSVVEQLRIDKTTVIPAPSYAASSPALASSGRMTSVNKSSSSVRPVIFLKSLLRKRCPIGCHSSLSHPIVVLAVPDIQAARRAR